MSDKDAKLAEMDAAAAEARKELMENLEQWSARELIAWWSRRYLTAGHKRLGRVLVALSKED
jgi:hypothetical protein